MNQDDLAALLQRGASMRVVMRYDQIGIAFNRFVKPVMRIIEIHLTADLSRGDEPTSSTVSPPQLFIPCLKGADGFVRWFADPMRAGVAQTRMNVKVMDLSGACVYNPATFAGKHLQPSEYHAYKFDHAGPLIQVGRIVEATELIAATPQSTTTNSEWIELMRQYVAASGKEEVREWHNQQPWNKANNNNNLLHDF